MSRERAAPTAADRQERTAAKALVRRNVLAAVAAAGELPQLSLTDALELTFLIARKDPRRHPRACVLQRH